MYYFHNFGTYLEINWRLICSFKSITTLFTFSNVLNEKLRVIFHINFETWISQMTNKDHYYYFFISKQVATRHVRSLSFSFFFVISRDGNIFFSSDRFMRFFQTKCLWSWFRVRFFLLVSEIEKYSKCVELAVVDRSSFLMKFIRFFLLIGKKAPKKTLGRANIKILPTFPTVELFKFSKERNVK